MIDLTLNLPEIKVWDNLFDDRFILELDEQTNEYPWKLNISGNRYSFPNKTKGNYLFWGVKFDIKNLPPIILDIYNHLTMNIINQNFTLLSSHINGQSMGQDGTCHIDSLPNLQTHTLMVFINYKWEKEWGGDFQLLKEYDDNAEITQSIKYIPGRIILFDGSIPHRGLAPLKPYIIRKSLVFRLKKI